MTDQKAELEMKTLYQITGNAADINTILINRGEFRNLRARVAELEAQLESIGAGGIGPLISAPQPPVVDRPETVPVSAYDRLQALCDSQAARIMELEQPQGDQEPMFWYRPRSDGLYEGPLHKSQIERVRKESGGWVPLHTHPQNLQCKSNQHRLATLWGYEKPQPKRKPLSDDQIIDIGNEVHRSMQDDADDQEELLAIAREIERAHGIGGEA